VANADYERANTVVATISPGPITGPPSGMRRRRGRALKLEEQLVGVAPPPVLSGLEGPDQGVVVVPVPVGRGVTVGRVVAAPDVAAVHAKAQVDPLAARAQAVLAALGGRGHVGHGVEVRACVSRGQDLLECGPAPLVET